MTMAALCAATRMPTRTAFRVGVDLVPRVAAVGRPAAWHSHVADPGAPEATGNAGEHHSGHGGGREVGERRFGGVRGVPHTDPCHRDDDLHAAERAEIEMPAAYDGGRIIVERGADKNRIRLGGESGQDQGALFGFHGGIGAHQSHHSVAGSRVNAIGGFYSA